MEYFNPFVTSPHSYPNGNLPILPHSAEKDPAPPSTTTTTTKKSFGIDYYSTMNKQKTSPSETKTSAIAAETFDPRISPHQYSTATTSHEYPLVKTPTTLPPQQRGQQRRKKVGILLMDHGSKNPAANQRLHNLATLYQQQQHFQRENNTDDNKVEVIVTAAHMEIATPSIPQGLEWLVSQQVDEIICHPYFLSPGRHVTQDIPQIVQQAIQDLQIDPMSIPVRTTEPVGSNTLLMMGAIHALVKEHSQVLRQQPTYNSST
jgi:hypothetical protein